MSIHPGFAEAILAGRKRVEFRKRRLAPDVDTVLVYATKPVGAVVGLFDLDGTDVDSPDGLWERHGHHGSIGRADYDAYYRGRETAVALRVAGARRLPAPVSLATVGTTHAPQSFAYLPRSVLDRLEPAAAVARPAASCPLRGLEPAAAVAPPAASCHLRPVADALGALGRAIACIAPVLPGLRRMLRAAAPSAPGPPVLRVVPAAARAAAGEAPRPQGPGLPPC